MNKLSEIRQQQGKTQEFMAEKIGTSIVAYHLYETGQRNIPIEKAKKIADILNVKLEDFFIPYSFSLR